MCTVLNIEIHNVRLIIKWLKTTTLFAFSFIDVARIAIFQLLSNLSRVNIKQMGMNGIVNMHLNN